MLLSAFRLTSETRFNELTRKDRHHLVASLLQHAGGIMRFGHFRDRQYTLDSFSVDAADGTVRLVTDWSRYAGRRQFLSSSQPARASKLCGTTFTRRTAISWTRTQRRRCHFARLQRDQETRVFAPENDTTCSRDDRQVWLRDVLGDALPVAERQAQASVGHVSPHSFRTVIATHRVNMPLEHAKGSAFVCWTPMLVYVEADERFPAD